MAANVQVGSSENSDLPDKSLGIIFYNELKKKNPHKTILVDDATSEEITYSHLLEVSVKLAVALTKLGVKKGDVVTIIAENSWKHASSILAGFFIGATVNLLNHDYMTGELKHFLEICQPVLIFCTTKSLENILKLRNESFFNIKNLIIYDTNTSHEVQIFDDLLEKTTEYEIFHPTELDPKQDVALILTSSGTTGLPKCVMLTHTNFRLTLSYSNKPDSFDVNEKEKTIGFLPFFHIFGCAMVLVSVLQGAKCIILKKFDAEKFLAAIEKHKISKLFLVPPVLQFLIMSPMVKQFNISSINDLVCGGAPVSRELLETTKKQLNIQYVRQLYGMTEISGAATIIPKCDVKYGSVGKVNFSHQIKVCEVETGKLLPPKEIGELRIFCPGLMKGYLGNITESVNAFDGEGFLKSGDLGYYDEDGFFYIVDRLKEIIKCKGFQVSPAELENVLLQHPSVKDVGVIGIPDEKAGEVPLAFVVKQSDRNVTEVELVRFVEKNMSVQKRLYGGVQFIERIPRSASGKILRRELKTIFVNTVKTHVS